MMASKNPSDSLVSINGKTGTLEFTALQNLYISSKLIIIGNIKKSAPYSIAILISLVYQYRVGFSGVLVSMGAVGAAMFLAALMVGSVTNPESGNPLLAIFIILNFIVLMTIYFRNQSNF